MKTKILHIAIENFAGLPYTIVQSERKLGFDSRLVTFYRPFQNFDEDISLELPFVKNRFASFMRRHFGSTSNVEAKRRPTDELPPYWNYRNSYSKFFHRMRDMLWKSKIDRSEVPDLIDSADIIVLDGGQDFVRDCMYIKRFSRRSEKIVETFYGSDLRTRGVIKDIDDMSKLRFTMEFDHLSLYPGIKFLYFPFDASIFVHKKTFMDNGRIRIGHSPTKRSAKGTDIILPALEDLKKTYPIDIVLIEGLSHKEALALKSSCDIFIDQIGELGYGVSALEALSMGIPVCVQLMPDFEEFLGKHPFINVNSRNIPDTIAQLIENRSELSNIGECGRVWVNDRHKPLKTVEIMVSEYKNLNWL